MKGKTITGLVPEYIKTGNEELKEIIYSKYFKIIDKKLSTLNISKEDKEDLSQSLKEYMFIAINRVLTLEVKPKSYVTYLGVLLHDKLNCLLKELKQDNNTISLNTIDVYSNENLIKKVENNIIKEDVIQTLIKLKNTTKNKDYTRLIKYYGIGCYPKTMTDISNEEGYKECHPAMSEFIRRAQTNLYNQVCKKYPMTKKDNILVSLEDWIWEFVPPTFNDTNEEYITYNDYNDINDSHQYRLK